MLRRAGVSQELDLCVDGVALKDRLKLDGRETRSFLAGTHPDLGRGQLYAELLADAPPSAPGGRVHLYTTCAVCEDLACGTVAVRVTRKGDTVKWSDFASTWSLDEEIQPIRFNPAFLFDWSDYSAELLGGVG